MKFATITFAIGTVAATSQCPATNCADWDCTAPGGAESWCSCYDSADDAIYAATPGCSNDDGNDCDCAAAAAPTCTANVNGDTCGNNGGLVCPDPFCTQCDNAPAYMRTTWGGCGTCGHRHRGPCDDGTADPKCEMGSICSTHTCFVMDATTAPASKRMGYAGITTANTYEGLCEGCGFNGAAVCPSTLSPNQCTPGQTPELGRTNWGGCGTCGHRHRGPCDDGTADPKCEMGSICSTHTCFVMDATTAPASKRMGYAGITTANTYEGLCEFTAYL